MWNRSTCSWKSFFENNFPQGHSMATVFNFHLYSIKNQHFQKTRANSLNANENITKCIVRMKNININSIYKVILLNNSYETIWTSREEYNNVPLAITYTRFFYKLQKIYDDWSFAARYSCSYVGSYVLNTDRWFCESVEILGLIKKTSFVIIWMICHLGSWMINEHFVLMPLSWVLVN